MLQVAMPTSRSPSAARSPIGPEPYQAPRGKDTSPLAENLPRCEALPSKTKVDGASPPTVSNPSPRTLTTGSAAARSTFIAVRAAAEANRKQKPEKRLIELFIGDSHEQK